MAYAFSDTSGFSRRHFDDFIYGQPVENSSSSTNNLEDDPPSGQYSDSILWGNAPAFDASTSGGRGDVQTMQGPAEQELDDADPSDTEEGREFARLRRQLPYLQRFPQPTILDNTPPTPAFDWGNRPSDFDAALDADLFGDIDWPSLPSPPPLSTTSYTYNNNNNNTAIDLTESPPLSTAMPPASRKRNADAASAASSSAPTPKRARMTQAGPSQSSTSRKPVEQIDLSLDDDEEQALREKALSDQLAVQDANDKKDQRRSRLTQLQCNICLESPTDLTATVCGHTFCRACLLDWLVSSERDASRRPTCPTCRRGLVREPAKNRRDVVPLVFMKRQV